MINEDVWESLDGTKTRVRQMDTQHLINAIECVERNDPRYGVKHGAALPAMRNEICRRAPTDIAARRFCLAKGLILAVGIGREPGINAPTTLAAVDDRAGRAHRRIDKIETTLREMEANPTNMVKRRLDAVEASLLVLQREAEANNACDKSHDDRVSALESQVAMLLAEPARNVVKRVIGKLTRVKGL